MRRPVIVLVGFMGAGKSTVGRLVAERLGVPFVDSDDVVVERAGCSVREFFAVHGEAEFRELERATVLDLLRSGAGVVALGGGALGSSAVVAGLRGHTVVHLDAGLGEVLRRIGDDPERPMLRRHDVRRLYDDRRSTYAQVATVVVPADDGEPKAVADEVVRALGRDGSSSGRAATTREPRAVVIGPPGSGTTTVGHLVASRLGVAFVDVDDEVARRAGCPAGELFVEEGEDAYRELERTCTLDLLDGCDGVVVLGGGAVLADGVRAALAGLRVAFLDVGIADAARRIGFDANPGLVLLNPRRAWIVQMGRLRPVYGSLATWTLDTAGRSAQDVADELVGLLEGEEA